MLELMTQLHFIRPYWLLAFLPAFMLFYFLLKQKHAFSNWRNVCDEHLLPHLLITQSQFAARWPYWVLLFSLSLAIIALSGPTWSKHQQAIYQTAGNTVVVLDMSMHMEANDIKPNRLTQAKLKIRQLLQKLDSSNIGMVVFTSEPFTVSPLTNDSHTIDLLIPTLATDIMPIQGSNISRALEFASELLIQGGGILGHMLLVTASTVDDNAIKTASQLAEKGLTLSVLGIGTEQGAPIMNPNGALILDEAGNIILSKLNRASLQKLAMAGNGRYYDYLPTNQEIDAIATQLAGMDTQKNPNEQTVTRWKDKGQWFILMLLPFALMSFRRGWLEQLL